MNRFELNKIGMGWTVDRVLTDNNGLIILVPAVSPLQLRLRDVLNKIEGKQGELTEDKKGKTEAKTITKHDLIDDAVIHYGQFYLYADEINDVELRNWANVSDHQLMHLGEDNLKPTLKVLLQKFDLVNTEPKKPELATYDLSLDVKAEFESKLNLFASQKTDVKTGRTDKSSARTSLTDLFHEYDHILLLLDKAMLKFKKTHPEFYQKYVSARVIIDLGGKHGGNDDTPPPENPEPPQ